MFSKGVSGNPNGRPKGKSIACLILKLSSEVDTTTGKSKAEYIAEKLIDIALQSTDPKFLMEYARWLSEATDGKPVQSNINTEVAYNPLEGIDTAKIEALKKKLEEQGGT